MCIEQELVVMHTRFRLIAFTFVMKYDFEKINEKEGGKSGFWL